jgi:hypothetical protein
MLFQTAECLHRVPDAGIHIQHSSGCISASQAMINFDLVDGSLVAIGNVGLPLTVLDPIHG